MTYTIKKIEYIAESLLSDHVKENYPKFVDFIKVYLRFLDENYFGKLISLTDNCSPNTIFSELLNDYMDTYFKNIINLDKYNLTDDNKRIFMGLSKLITGLKGNYKSFNFVFKSLTDFDIVSLGQHIDSLDIIYSENINRPFVYNFAINADYEIVRSIVEQLHPAGFLAIYAIYPFFEEDQVSLVDESHVFYYVYPLYNGQHYYDGSIHYDKGSATEL